VCYFTYRSLKDLVESEIGAADFEHIFFEHEVLAPEVLHVRLELGTEGTVVVETGDTTVDFETWSEEKLLLKQILTLLTLVLLCEILVS
jgi:hypothetical protein